MARTGLARAVLSLLVAGVIGMVLAGCGGGEGEGAAPPPGGTSTITGRVVDAANTSVGLADAQVSVVSVQSRGRATTDDEGNFTLTGVPSGVVRLRVTPPSGYRAGAVDVDVPADETLALVITLVPAAAAQPATLTVSPVSASVQVGVPKTFTATVRDEAGNVLALTPTWTVSAGLGAISASGVFTGAAEGSGTATATCGAATGTAVVTVTAATAPRITGLNATPTTLGPTGGAVLFTAQVEAGGRIQSVVLRIRRAGSATATDVPLTPLAGATEFTASYEQSYTFGPNDSTGFTEDNVYTVTVVATDMRALSTESDPLSVVVLSADQPPPEPT
jgi:hypothetical protein